MSVRNIRQAGARQFTALMRSAQVVDYHLVMQASGIAGDLSQQDI
jgi:hypothetical protein